MACLTPQPAKHIIRQLSVGIKIRRVCLATLNTEGCWWAGYLALLQLWEVTIHNLTYYFEVHPGQGMCKEHSARGGALSPARGFSQ